MFNLALPRSWATNLNPGLHSYYLANLATWQAGANNAANPNASQIAADLVTLANALSSQTPGTTLNGNYKYTANTFVQYALDGPLKGFSVGGGANIRGPQKEGVGLTSAYDYLYSPYHYLITANLQYAFRLMNKIPCQMQLNVSNLLDTKSFIYTSFGTYRVGGIATNPLIQTPGNTLISDPRKFTLSTRLSF